MKLPHYVGEPIPLNTRPLCRRHCARDSVSAVQASMISSRLEETPSDGALWAVTAATYPVSTTDLFSRRSESESIINSIKVD